MGVLFYSKKRAYFICTKNQKSSLNTNELLEFKLGALSLSGDIVSLDDDKDAFDLLRAASGDVRPASLETFDSKFFRRSLNVAKDFWYSVTLISKKLDFPSALETYANSKGFFAP